MKPPCRHDVQSEADCSTYNEAETPIRPIPSFAELGHMHEVIPGSPSPVVAPSRPTRSPSPFKLEKDALHMRMKHKAVVNGNGYAAAVGNGATSTSSIREEREKEEAEEHKGSRGRRRPIPHYDAEGELLRAGRGGTALMTSSHQGRRVHGHWAARFFHHPSLLPFHRGSVGVALNLTRTHPTNNITHPHCTTTHPVHLYPPILLVCLDYRMQGSAQR